MQSKGQFRTMLNQMAFDTVRRDARNARKFAVQVSGLSKRGARRFGDTRLLTEWRKTTTLAQGLGQVGQNVSTFRNLTVGVPTIDRHMNNPMSVFAESKPADD